LKGYFKHKTIIVTGASSGIGKAMVEMLSTFDTNLVLCARNEALMNALVQDLKIPPEKYLIIKSDFAAQPNFQEITKQILSKFPRIDILINNAGIAQKSMVQETEELVERRVMEVNYFATVNFTKAVLPHFIARKQGHLVTISSILGEIGLPKVAPYCASKHALNGYYNSLRYDVEQYNILVSIVSPGFIQTAITKKSLTGSGGTHNEDSVTQEKGMDAKLCAKGILKNIANETRQSYVGGLEVLMPKFAFFFPKIFHFLMKKMHKI
jgi:short-subunit dehydrogenase